MKKTAAETKPRASGPTKTNEERRESGRVRVSLWLTEDEAAALEKLCARGGHTRRDVIGAALLAMVSVK